MKTLVVKSIVLATLVITLPQAQAQGDVPKTLLGHCDAKSERNRMLGFEDKATVSLETREALLEKSGAFDLDVRYGKTVDDSISVKFPNGESRDFEVSRQSYDIFYHPKALRKTPLIIYFHGGGFVSGDKCGAYFKKLNIEFPRLMENNYAFATVNYRFKKNVVGKGALAIMNDGFRVLQLIKHRARKYNIDSSKIILMGTSAGSSIIQFMNYQDDQASPDAIDPVRRQSTKVLGAIARETQATMNGNRWYGEVFPEEVVSYLSEEDKEALTTSYYELLGYESEQEMIDNPKRTAEYSKKIDFLEMIDADDAPVLLENTKQFRFWENIIPLPRKVGAILHHYNHTEVLSKKMDEVGLPYVFNSFGKEQWKGTDEEYNEHIKAVRERFVLDLLDSVDKK